MGGTTKVMVFVYTMSTKEPYWTVDVIEPEQTEDVGWTYGGVLYHKYPVTHIDGYDAKVTMATVTKTEEEVKELLRKSLNTAILDLWQHVSSALVRRVEKIKEI